MAATKEPHLISSQHNFEIEKIQKDLLWGLYQDVRSHARHAETLRANANNYMLVFATALIAAITIDKKIDLTDLALSFILTLIGLVTALFSASYAELYFRNRERAERIRAHLDASFFQNGALTRLYAPKKTAAVSRRGVKTALLFRFLKSRLTFAYTSVSPMAKDCTSLMQRRTEENEATIGIIEFDTTYKFKWARNILSTHWFWLLLPGAVFATGICLMYMCIFHNVVFAA